MTAGMKSDSLNGNGRSKTSKAGEISVFLFNIHPLFPAGIIPPANDAIMGDMETASPPATIAATATTPAVAAVGDALPPAIAMPPPGAP